MYVRQTRPPGRGDCWILEITHAPSRKNVLKNGLPQKGGSLSVEGVFAKKFSGAGEDSAGSACVRLQSRACGRGVFKEPSAAQFSGLISGLLGLEGISKRKDSHCRSGRLGGPAQVKDRTCAAVRREAEEDLGQAFRICDDFDSSPHRAIILFVGRCADSRAAERKA